MNKKIENFIEHDDRWYSDLELKVLDLEKELTEWRESRTREPGPGSGSPPRREREMLRARGKAERPSSERAQALIERGRRTARRRRSGRGRTIAIASAAGLAVLVIGAMIVLRPGPSWPPSVATVKSEIATACQNPNVVSEPSQVNFACGTDTSQILWIFAASQLLAVIGVILAWIVKWAVIMAVVIFAVLGLVYLFLDRR